MFRLGTARSYSLTISERPQTVAHFCSAIYNKCGTCDVGLRRASEGSTARNAHSMRKRVCVCVRVRVRSNITALSQLHKTLCNVLTEYVCARTGAIIFKKIARCHRRRFVGATRTANNDYYRAAARRHTASQHLTRWKVVRISLVVRQQKAHTHTQTTTQQSSPTVPSRV